MELDKQYAKRRCGLTSTTKTPVTINEQQVKTITQRLESLKTLKEKGLITEEEYKQKRSDILNDI
jgi:cytochrome c-type biogenesis protein CcmH/NrfG